jgi:hypothetical protein
MSNNDTTLQPYQQAALQDFGWREDDLKLVRETYARDATDAEFRLYLYMARTYRLDPLLKQIWLVKYGNKPAQIFAGRDGFLAIGHRTGKLNGMQSGVRVEQVPLKVIYRQDSQPKEFTRDFQYVGWARVWIYRSSLRGRGVGRGV